ncbi:MAG: hypothetical protein NC543_12090 [bacterium]|nr:hypothetical protein [bacterium]MCM1376102.1 hypothetical protein [Muribaculum sp.]
MEKYKDSDRDLLILLLKMQEQTSPIKISIGYITDSNHVCQGIVLHEAPPKVIATLIEEGYVCELTGRGMKVYKF